MVRCLFSDLYQIKHHVLTIYSSISVDRNHINPLLEYLNRNCHEYHDSPRTTFAIDTLQYPTFTVPVRDRRDSQPQKRTRWPTTITCTFNANGSIDLWNCLTDHDDLVIANCVSLDRYVHILQ